MGGEEKVGRRRKLGASRWFSNKHIAYSAELADSAVDYSTVDYSTVDYSTGDYSTVDNFTDPEIHWCLGADTRRILL